MRILRGEGGVLKKQNNDDHINITTCISIAFTSAVVQLLEPGLVNGKNDRKYKRISERFFFFARGRVKKI